MATIISLNDRVKVKLNDYGRQIHYHYFDRIIDAYEKTGKRCPLKREYPDVDKDGFSEFYLWEFIALYGKYIRPRKKSPIDSMCLIVCGGPEIKIGVFDQEEIHENCTVQIWSNSVTGEISIGWRENT